ncbi:ATP-dependent DNA helicase RecG [Nevskia sp.]|uniref:ATP-dependent DNA helicase RecG n=1 Tax=Nevskia sp. TaxID=1929292 RepID=UPI0025E32320|nr:ATP-dependent DNA helicase RecG [Nevskia sp.]
MKPGTKPALTLDTELTFLKGAGPAVASRLKPLGLERVRDLLLHLPIRYEDRRRIVPIADVAHGVEALVCGQIVSAEVRFGAKRWLRVVIDDGRSSMVLRFFHFNEAQKAAMADGRWLRAFGGVRVTANGPEIVHPEYRIADSALELPPETRLTPIYGLATGITQTRVRALIQQALAVAQLDPDYTADFPGLGGPATLAALRTLHEPDGRDLGDLLLDRHPAQIRLVREELLAHQLCMRLLRKQTKAAPGARIEAVLPAAARLQEKLPFAMTGAQRRVISDIAHDLAAGKPMLRLIQGDVGSGKTVVAAAAMLGAAMSGLQSVLMAPTELLVEQHARTLNGWLAPLGIEVGLLTGKMKKSERDEALRRAASGATSVWVGTHALFQGDMKLKKLGLIVVDEQHRFGVGQRLALRDKGPAGVTPHQLIMSATPIPRTLAQTVYADLDVSVIDELPPGRTPVQTVVLSNERRFDVLSRIGEACRQGRQAYWVCTLIEENTELQAQAAEETYRQLREELPELKVGLVHGRLKAVEKDAQMRAFQSGATQLLVATTVIEVGVDVPNASIMIIDNAERLGLSQLHQLRGRVGRGATASQCLLMYQPPLGQGSKARLDVMRTTNDGFVIAQKDLELRGPGELLGRRQTGLVGMKIADPVRDSALIGGLQKLADDWWLKTPKDARRMIARWIGDADRYAQV